MRTTRLTASATAMADSIRGCSGRCKASGISTGTTSSENAGCIEAWAYSVTSAGNAVTAATMGSLEVRMGVAGLLGFLRATVRKRSSPAGASAGDGACSMGRGKRAVAPNTTPIAVHGRVGISAPTR